MKDSYVFVFLKQRVNIANNEPKRRLASAIKFSWVMPLQMQTYVAALNPRFGI